MTAEDVEDFVAQSLEGYIEGDTPAPSPEATSEPDVCVTPPTAIRNRSWSSPSADASTPVQVRLSFDSFVRKAEGVAGEDPDGGAASSENGRGSAEVETVSGSVADVDVDKDASALAADDDDAAAVFSDDLGSGTDGATLSSPEAVALDTALIAKRDALQGLLLVVAVTEPSISYTQGMNYIAALLLETLPSASVAYNMVRRLFRQYDFNTLFSRNLQALGLRFYQFERLLSRHLPRLSNHLTVEGASPAMYASAWFLTVFSTFKVVDLPSTLMIWDRFLCSGWKEVFRFALAVMQMLEPHILEQQFEVMLPILQTPRVHHQASARSLAALANRFDVSQAHLSELEAQFTAKMRSGGRNKLADSPPAVVTSQLRR